MRNSAGGDGQLIVGGPPLIRRRAGREGQHDATCTQSADLAGMYFAVQASYEQQIVNANQQALNTAVQQYKAAYAAELKKLPALLKTAKANAFPKAVATSKG